MSFRIDQNNNTLSLSGDITFSNLKAWCSLFDQILKQKTADSFVVDFSGVSHSDNAALPLMTTWLRHARSFGIKVRYLNIPDHLLDIARLYGVEELLKSY